MKHKMDATDVIAIVSILSITAIFITFFVGWMIAQYKDKETHCYPMTAIVVDVSTATDTVTVKDYNGNLWQFKGVEDWYPGDICSCIMDSKGTELIKDDEILCPPRYDGTLEGWNEFIKTGE